MDDALLARYRALCASPRVRAIGEIGLDYYWEQNPPREFQQEVFRDQLALAQELVSPSSCTTATRMLTVSPS